METTVTSRLTAIIRKSRITLSLFCSLALFVKKGRIFFLIAFLAAQALSNASPSYNVLVSVVDSKTGHPVEGATVSAHEITAVTGKDGRAMLKLSSGGRMPVFEVKVVNEKYDDHRGYSTTRKDWTDRSEDFIPTKPDIVLKVTSRIDEKRAEAKMEAERKSDEDAAEKLFRHSPDYWPPRKDDPYPSPGNEVGWILLRKRWERASEKELGSTEDTESIRAAVIQHMKVPESKVNSIRWISPNVVMVSSSWYKGPLASAGYTYVLRKSKKGWSVVAYYMNYVS
jgi:hypothetical protein